MIRIPVIRLQRQKLAHQRMFVDQISASFRFDLDDIEMTELLFHLTAESIPERIRNRLSPDGVISINDNAPDRPFF